MDESENIFKAFLRGLMRQIKAMDEALKARDYAEAEKILNNLQEDIQKDIDEYEPFVGAISKKSPAHEELKKVLKEEIEQNVIWQRDERNESPYYMGVDVGIEAARKLRDIEIKFNKRLLSLVESEEKEE